MDGCITAPIRVSLYTTDCYRIRLLEHIANCGSHLSTVHRIAHDLALQARQRMIQSGQYDQLGAEQARALLAYVHTRPYFAHPPDVEEFKPVTLTIDEGGNCEDLGPLYVALARASGLVAQLVWINQHDAPLNHVSAQVWLDGQWHWAEPSVAGAQLGEDPYAAAARMRRPDVVSAAAGVWSRDRIGYRCHGVPCQ